MVQGRRRDGGPQRGGLLALVSGKGRRHGQQGIIASKEGAKVFCGVGHVDLGPFGRGQLGLC